MEFRILTDYCNENKPSAENDWLYSVWKSMLSLHVTPEKWRIQSPTCSTIIWLTIRFPSQSQACTSQKNTCPAIWRWRRARAANIVEYSYYIYTYKRVVCVCLFVGLFFIGHTRFPTLRRCLRVPEQEPSGGPARAGKHAQREHARACRTTYFSTKKIVALMPFKNKTVRGRPCCRIRNCWDFQKKAKRKPTCHFPSSVYSLPSLGVFTFRIVLNRILHKSSLLAPMESRRTRQPTFTAEERLERRREQDRRRHAERRARERREQTQVRRDVDRLPSSQARA